MSSSVPIVAFVRLVYLIKLDVKSTNVVVNIANVLILTSVEVNMSIICGQYNYSTLLFFECLLLWLKMGGARGEGS